MKRITGTHLYSYAACPRAVALDLHEDPAKRRAPTEAEEFVLQRGRELEARVSAELGYPVPQYPERDFEAGAVATRALLERGVPGVLQAVLLGPDRLGIADIVRREPGESRFGEWHYVPGDIKSSGLPRSDQILQVMFYARLLARLQDRVPDYAFLVLRDGHEERFACADYAPVLEDVEARIEALRGQPELARPFFAAACGSCRWSDLCVPQLQQQSDLSLLQGMTRGLRTMLESAGITDVAAAAQLTVEPIARRTRLEASLLRRIRKSAQAHLARQPLRERSTRLEDGREAALVHLLADPFAERVAWFGVRYPAGEAGAVHQAWPQSREQELPALQQLIHKVPSGVSLLHYGETLPRWHERVAWRKHALPDLEARLIDLAHRLRAAAVWPGPVFGLDGHVRFALAADPRRCGDPAAVGLWMQQADARTRLSTKGVADLEDLSRLWTWLQTATAE